MHRVAWRILPVAMATVLAGLRPAVAFVPSAGRLQLASPLALSGRNADFLACPSVARIRPAHGLRMVATVGADTKITGPEWSNDDEYSSLDAPELKADLDSVSSLIDELTVLSSRIDMDKLDSLDTDVLVQMTRKSTEAVVLLSNVAVFASCESSVDGSNLEARSLQVLAFV